MVPATGRGLRRPRPSVSSYAGPVPCDLAPLPRGTAPRDSPPPRRRGATLPMSVSYPTKIILAFGTGGRCTLPSCNRPLAREEKHHGQVLVGQAAHIAGERPGSPRYDAAMTPEERNAPGNLIYLCPDCHRLIDRAWRNYPTNRLHAFKQEREQSVQQDRVAAMPRIGLAELNEAVRYFEAHPFTPAESDFHLIQPEEKLRRNGLGSSSRNLVRMGLAAAGQVRELVVAKSRSNPDFMSRLKHAFQGEYLRLREEGRRGDDLFTLMCAFADGGRHDPIAVAAGVALVAYLFETCEIFEK